MDVHSAQEKLGKPPVTCQIRVSVVFSSQYSARIVTRQFVLSLCIRPNQCRNVYVKLRGGEIGDRSGCLGTRGCMVAFSPSRRAARHPFPAGEDPGGPAGAWAGGSWMRRARSDTACHTAPRTLDRLAKRSETRNTPSATRPARFRRFRAAAARARAGPNECALSAWLSSVRVPTSSLTRVHSSTFSAALGRSQPA